MELTEERIQRYSRHILLPEVGGRGQRRLLDAKVAIAFSPDAAGPAAVAAVYLAAAGVGRIVWWPRPPEEVPPEEVEEGSAAPGGSLAPLAGLYGEAGPRGEEGEAGGKESGGGRAAALRLPQLEALNPDVRLELAGPEKEGTEAALPEGLDLLVALGGGASLGEAARRSSERSVPLLRGGLDGWAGAVRREEGGAVLEEACNKVPAKEPGESLPPAPAEGVLGSLVAAAALRLLLGGESPVGSTAQARFDLSDGRWTGVR